MEAVSGREKQKRVDDGSSTKVLALPSFGLEGYLVRNVAWASNCPIQYLPACRRAKTRKFQLNMGSENTDADCVVQTCQLEGHHQENQDRTNRNYHHRFHQRRYLSEQ